MPALLLIVFVDLIGFGIVLPLQPFYAQAYGASPATVTLVAASYTAMQFVSAPLWGRLSDRIGRKPIILMTSAGACVGYFALAHTDSLAGLFLARAFGGAMAGNIGVAHAYVADLVGPSGRARGMGRVGAAAGLGFVAGPALGGLLSGPDPANPDFQLPFLVAAAAAAVAFVLASVLLKESVTGTARERARRAGPADRWWRRVREAGIAPLLLLVFATPMVFSGIETVFALWSERALGWGPVRNGYMYSYMGAVAVLVQGFAIGPIAARLGERYTVAVGMTSVAAGCMVMPVADGMALVMVGLGLTIFGVSICGPSLTSLVAERAASHERGTLLGISQSAGGLGRIVGPALSGTVLASLGLDWPFVLGAIVMAAAAVLALTLAHRHRGSTSKSLTERPPSD